MVGTARFEPATPCSQRKSERADDELAEQAAEVAGAGALTVGVRWRPFGADARGTVVARPARANRAGTQRLRDYLACRARPVLGDDLPRWQGRRPAAALWRLPFERDSAACSAGRATPPR